VFGFNTTLSSPDRFISNHLDGLLNERQMTQGKTPCGFFGHATILPPDGTTTIFTVFGHAGNEEHLINRTERICNPAYVADKQMQARALALDLTDPVASRTNSPIFDAYCRQTYLDNLVRGGWPLMLEDKNPSQIVHIYSRKHGDLERDYNDFYLAAEPYSWGEVNYRDVNQNRRCDVLFYPQIRDINIRNFMSLVQADGYNPLVIEGLKFTLPKEKQASILKQVEEPDRISALLAQPFTPGKLLKHITDREIDLSVSREDFLTSVLMDANQNFEASFGEGYWVDHWTYNLDLIESYLAVFPDRRYELLLGGEELPFYDSPAIVRPRAQKYVLADGVPHQYGAVVEDPEKAALIERRELQPHWVRTKHGHGVIYRTSLFTKLVFLALIKFTTMDPYGMGIEMEADKPGWYDAMNGLPGLFGSSMPETYELLRLIEFLVKFIDRSDPFTIDVPVEIGDMISQTRAHLSALDHASTREADFIYWDKMAKTREEYRAKIRLGFEGTSVKVTSPALLSLLESFAQKINIGIDRALSLNNGFPPTYFTFEAEDYEILRDENGKVRQDDHKRPLIRIHGFKARALPHFLEGVVKALKLQTDQKAARDLYQKVKESPLYDPTLKMYRVNASLEQQPHEIGRARAFTPGWLENGSIWLHMEYKFLLEVLKSGLYPEFYKDFKNALIPFQDPTRYGRSQLENSSFIVSSVHPDESLHGAGFVARLSGSTAEFLSLWQLMMAGEQPFFVREDALCLSFQPSLPGWLFDEKDTVAFTFLGQCQVVYHNPHKRDTHELNSQRVILHPLDGDPIEIEGAVILAPYADMVRAGQISEIQIFFDKGT
jgi:hypothetical protein